MNAVVIKAEEELEKMRHAGKLLAQVFAMLDDFVQAGVTTMEINDRVEDYIVNTLKARPASRGQYDYPSAPTSSVHQVARPGMPNNVKLKSGSILNLDITLEHGGYIADSSKMYLIGEVAP